MQGQRTSFASATISLVRDPVAVILVLAGIFDWLSGNPIHSLLLLTVGLALGQDAIVGRSSEAAPPAPAAANLRVGPAGIALASAYVVLVGGFGRYSWPATVAVLCPAAGVLLIAWRGNLNKSAGSRKLDPIGALAWASVFVALAIWELTELLLQPSLKTDSYAHPTISVLTDPVLATHPGRSIVLSLWLALGWFLVQR